MRNLVLFTALAAWNGVAESATAAEWAQRSIYQVITDRFAVTNGSLDVECPDLNKYCGGTWAGLANNLDYIQDMGFTAVLISPVVQNIDNDTEFGEAYHGYWPIDNYALNANFGDADDLIGLSNELHSRDMYLMVDVVVNNMAQAIIGSMPQPIDYSVFNPFNDAKYFHPYCNITDYANSTNAQDCYLGATAVALPDLYTESDEVIKLTSAWITELVTNYSLDGLRIDAAKHVDDAFLPFVNTAAGVFTMGEVYSGAPGDMCRYQQSGLLQGLPDYIEYFPLIRAFTAGDMPSLHAARIYTETDCTDTSVLATFAENQDLPRFASIVSDVTLAMNALAFVILGDGIPYVFQGQEQHMTGNYSPYNRENLWVTGYDTDAPLYNVAAVLNRLRNHAIALDSRYVANSSQELYYDQATLCTRKGPDGVQIVACFSNQGSNGGEYMLNVPGGFSEGEEVIEIFNCTQSTANSDGNVTAQMARGEPRVFFPVNNMNGSGLCGFSRNATTGVGGEGIGPAPSPKVTATGTTTSTAATTSSTDYAVPSADVRTGVVVMGFLIAAGASLL